MLDSTRNIYLRIENLWKKFDNVVALQDISLNVVEGEFLCFLGPSGCGNTTLLRAIAGLDLQTSGRIEQAGKDVSNLPPAERDFGIVFPSYALFPNLTIKKNISYGLENAKMSKTERDARVRELLEMVGLPEQGDRYPAQLSGGQQQRIALARAIASKPGLLLLDEPLSALDVKARQLLRHEIKELQRQLDVTTVMATHNPEEALSMADRIVVMNQGSIEQIGSPLEIYRDPASLFVADFIGAINQLPGKAQPEGVRAGAAPLFCTHKFPHGAPVIATIRPEDIIPTAEPGQNALETRIEAMEFHGSFFRATLSNRALGDIELIAEFSHDTVRRLHLAAGQSLMVQLPPDRIRVFEIGK